VTAASPRPPRRLLGRYSARVVDVALAAVYAVALGSIVVLRLVNAGATAAEVAPDVASLVVGVVAILLRRSRPAVVLPIAVAVQLLAFGLGLTGDVFVAAVLVYAVAAWWSVAVGWVVYGATLVATLVGSTVLRLLIEQPARPALVVSDVALLAIGGLVASLLGTAVGTRRRYVAALVARTAELAAERDRSAQLARTAERTRIAREMHDIVSHGLQLVVSAADAASAVAERDPARSRELMETAASTGRTAMREARNVFALLQDPDEGPAHAPAPGLAQLGELVESARRAGLRVDWSQEVGAALDETRQLAVHRIVQEALTNALRHAGSGSSVSVRISHAEQATTVDVLDDGPSGVPPTDADGAGLGLVGMRQRAEVLGGAVDAGPRVDGPGWVVHAVIPAAPEPG